MATQDPQTVLTEVKKVLVEIFEVPDAQITMETHLFSDLDLDSLDAIDLAAELKSRVGIKFTNDELRNIRTVGDVVNTILTNDCTPSD